LTVLHYRLRRFLRRRVYQQERDRAAFSMLSAAKIDEPYSEAGVVGFENGVRRLLYSYL